mgnify:CR=1 FL=1
MAFHTYILHCRDARHRAADDVPGGGIAQHRAGALGGYTASRLPVTFLWAQDFQTRDDAFAAERKLKGWSRAKKEAMIAGNWSLVSELARNGKAREGIAFPQGASTGSA